MTLESKTFFDVIKTHGLLTDKQLKKVEAAVTKDSITRSDLEKLVARKYLTAWQAKRLLAGKNNFSIGDFQLVDFIGKDDFGEVYLVRGKDENELRRLRLVSKEISEDSDKTEAYLQRVSPFLAIQHPALTRLRQVSNVGGRHMVVSDLVPTENLVNHIGQVDSAQALAKEVLESIGPVVQKLNATGLKHGSIHPASISQNPKGSWILDLPADIGFCPKSESADDSDLISLARVIGGSIVGNYGDSKAIESNALANQVLQASAEKNVTVDQLVRLVDGNDDSQAAATSEDESPFDIKVGDEQKVGNNQKAAVNAEDISVETGRGTEPEAAKSDEVAIQVDDLGTITSDDDVFGDIDQMEVASEIQLSNSYVDSSTVSLAVGQKDEKESNSKKATGSSPTIDSSSETKTSKPAQNQHESGQGPSNNKVLLFAAVGSGVGVIVLGLIIFLLTRPSDSENKLASNTNVESGDQTEKNEADSKSEAGNSTSSDEGTKAEDSTQKEISSGIFSNIGDINKGRPDSKNGVGNDGNQATGDQKQVAKKVGLDGSGGSPVAPDSNVPKNSQEESRTAKKETQEVPGNALIPGNPKPDESVKQNPDSKALTKEKKADTAKSVDAGKEMKKEAVKDEDEPVLLVGQPKKDKKESESKPKPAFKNPFSQSPGFVELEPPKKGTDVTKKQPLFPIEIPAGLPLVVTLHGGEHASKSKVKFFLKAVTSEDSTWTISAGKENSAKPIGRLKLENGNLTFNWESLAESFGNAVFLMNCALKIQAASYKHVVALRKPITTTPFSFEKNLSSKSDLSFSNLPNMDHVKVVLVDLPKNFPAFDYPKDQDCLTNQNREIELSFKKENIEVIKAFWGCRPRGSRLQVGMELLYVTPDKQSQELKTKAAFDKDLEKFLLELTAGEKNLKTINERLKVYENNQELKDQLAKNLGKDKLEEGLKKARNLKKHFLRTKAVLDPIAATKVNYRVYYQAGEVEVDLATPTGQRYSPRQPKPWPPKSE